jgi:hypothetical protein
MGLDLDGVADVRPPSGLLVWLEQLLDLHASNGGPRVGVPLPDRLKVTAFRVPQLAAIEQGDALEFAQQLQLGQVRRSRPVLLEELYPLANVTIL